jgi:hypothetical protein
MAGDKVFKGSNGKAKKIAEPRNTFDNYVDEVVSDDEYQQWLNKMSIVQ